jgi:outer membrane protein TolC
MLIDCQPALLLCQWPFIAALAALLLAGCAVGPNFKTPPAPNVTGYTAEPLATNIPATAVAGGEAQRLVQGLDIPGEWWAVFHSLQLNELIQRSLTNNPDLKAAQAALKVAHENVLAQRGAYFPSVDAGFSATRQKQSDLLAPIPNFPTVSSEFQYNLFTPEVSVSYMPDVFGLNRRTVESLKAQEQGVRFQLVATYLTLSANVVVQPSRRRRCAAKSRPRTS